MSKTAEPSKPSVLVAEDELILQELVAKLAKSWGYNVHVASTGASAWEKVKDPEVKVDIVLLDWIMPEMDGITLTKKVREEDIDCYIIMLSGNNNQAEIADAIDAGVDDFLPKGCDPQELKLRLRAAERIVVMKDALLELKKGETTEK